MDVKLNMTEAEAVFELLKSINMGDCSYENRNKKVGIANKQVGELKDMGIRFLDTEK